MTEETLFELALKTPEAARADLLDRECTGNPEMRARVEALLRADAGPSPISKHVQASNITTGFKPTDVYTSNDLGPGVVIAGRYTLEQNLGEGGMGDVWVAKQSEPVKRRVALKLIKAGMDSKSVVQRFEQERQALAMMDHPNIAKVLDGGLTTDRRPFFVMELVNGLPLTRFCDEAKLKINERLELFVSICQAVQHAHQKGIVHRDLKPGNILVTLIDGKAVPKVIDFGVAKATGGKLTEESMSTQFGAVIGTLEYMAPEQAGFSNQDIDTRADIYSLGIILYELLTGLRPFDNKRMKQAALDEIIRIIREEEPSKPSTRLSSDDSLPSLAAVRHIEPGKLTALLRGELDWVVMKCLEKQRDRRYETANGLARDIQRYLTEEPVEARPPSATYRMSKFISRNKGKVVASGLLLFTLLAGIVGTSSGLYQARQAAIAEGLAKDDAERKRIEAEDQKIRAVAGEKLANERLVQIEAEKKIAETVKDFLLNKILAQADIRKQFDSILQSGGSTTAAKQNPTLREVLDRAAKELELNESSFSNQSEVQAEVLSMVGLTYAGLGEYETAMPFLVRSVDLLRQHLGHDHIKTLYALDILGSGYLFAGKIRQALPLLEESLNLRRAKFGEEHPFTLISKDHLGEAYLEIDRVEQAAKLFEETFSIRKKRFGLRHIDTLRSMNNLGKAHIAASKLERAIQILLETLDIAKEVRTPQHSNTLVVMQNLASAYLAAGKLLEAKRLFEEVLEIQNVNLGADHPSTLFSLASLAKIAGESGELDRALVMHEQILKRRKAKLGPDHTSTMESMRQLALTYAELGKLEIANALGMEALKIAKDKHGLNHSHTIHALNDYGFVLLAMKHFDAALPLFVEARKQAKTLFSPDHSLVLSITSNIAIANASLGRLDVAVPLFEEVHTKCQSLLGKDHPQTLKSMGSLAVAYGNIKKMDRALPLAENAYQLQKTKLGETHHVTLITMRSLASMYGVAGKLNLAIPLGEAALQLFQTKFGKEHPETIGAMICVVILFEKARSYEKELPLAEKTYKLAKEQLGLKHPYTLTSMTLLGACYRTVGQHDRARTIFEESLQAARTVYHPDDPQLRKPLSDLAFSYLRDGKIDSTVALLEEENKLARKLSSPDSQMSLFTSLVNLAQAYQRNGNHKAALPKLKEAYELGQKLYPADNPRLANVMMGISYTLIHNKSYMEAETLLRECLALRRKSEPDSRTTFNTMSLLGESLAGQKKYAEAEPLLINGYMGIKKELDKMQPQGMIRVYEALDRLIQFYTETSKPEEVRKWQVEKAKLQGLPGK